MFHSHIKDIPYIFLGRGDSGDLLITVILPERKEITELRCEVYVDEGKCFSESASFQDEIIRRYSFQFRDLTHGQTYRYRLLVDDRDIDLGPGLTAKDLTFTHWKTLSASDQAVMMSCNGLFDYEGPDKHRHRMWERLFTVAEKRLPRLLILGGDQYYQDALEEVWIPKLKYSTFKQNYPGCKQASLANALSYMTHPAYRKLMATIPSVCMLDDHDLTDGAGGRADSFDGASPRFKEEWVNFLSIQKEIFFHLQASRNPTPIISKKLNAFSFILDLGECALVGLDLRTEKNSRLNQLMVSDTKEAAFTAIKELQHTQVYILSPIVPLRNAVKFEGQIYAMIEGFAPLLQSIKGFEKYADHLTGFVDDLDDCLISRCNRDFFTELLKIMAERSKRGVKYAFLSGDIHTGGSVEVFGQFEGHRFRIPLLIASPMGYQPMPWFVESILREKKILEFTHNDVQLEAVVGKFTSERNFIFLAMNRFFAEPNSTAVIYDEAVRGGRLLQTQEWLQDEEAPFANKNRSHEERFSFGG